MTQCNYQRTTPLVLNPLVWIMLVFLFAACCIGNSAYSADKKPGKTKKEKIQPALAKNYFQNSDSPQPLPSSVLKLLKKHKIPKDNISVYVRDLNADKPMLEHNVERLRNPASTMKLFTTYAALKTLGPNYSWRTEVWLRGKLEKGILNGDLVLKGYGDPFLVYEDFFKLLNALRIKGLKEINGDIVIDNSYFKLAKHNPAKFDGKAFRIYNAQPSALMFNFQATRFLFKPIVDTKAVKSKRKNKKSLKGKVEIEAYPRIKNLVLDNKVKLRKGRCRKAHLRPKFKRDKNGILEVSGNYSVKCKQRFITRTISTPEQHVFNAFRDFWKDMGGKLKGGLKIGKVSKGDELFHTHSSPTLGEQIRLINKWSNNVMTRQLLLTLGVRKFGSPGTVDKGIKALIQVLKESGIDTKGMRLENGSGLSRIAQVSTRQLAKLLEVAYRDAYMPEFMSSLALAGVDGTLVHRFRRDDLRGRSHFKTGTLDFVTAIAGYMLNRQGKRLIVVIQHNGKRTGAGRGAKIQDALLRWSFEQ